MSTGHPTTAAPVRHPTPKAKGLSWLMNKANGEPLTWLDIARFILRESPILALLLVFIWRLPEIDQSIREGYQQNAVHMEQISKHNLEMARVYQEGSAQRFAAVEAMMERLRSDIKQHQDMMRQQTLDNWGRIERLERWLDDHGVGRPPPTEEATP